jgi:hypothetical protein
MIIRVITFAAIIIGLPQEIQKTRNYNDVRVAGRSVPPNNDSFDNGTWY